MTNHRISTKSNNTGHGDNSLGEVTDIIPVTVYTCDKLGYITAYNQASVKLWGRAPEIGHDLWCGSWKIFTPGGEALSLDDCPMARTLKTRRPINGEEIVIQRPDGSRILVKAYPQPIFDSNGQLTGAVNTLIDVSEYKTGEEELYKLAAIIDTAEVPIISKTTEGIITSWNKAAEQFFGYTSGEAVGRSIRMLIPEDRQGEEDIILGKINRGERVEHYETIRIRKDKREVRVSLTISPIKNSAGKIIGASKIIIDITKQKEYENKLKRYAENVETLNTIGKLVSESLDIDEILQKVTDASTQVIGAAFGAFFYNKVDDNGESYMLYTLSGAPREAFEKFGMPRNTAVFSATFNGGGTVRVDDITKDPRYGHNHPHYGMPKGHLPVVSYLAVPVISKSGTVIGGLFYGHPEPAKFTGEHEGLAENIAAQASVALENAILYSEVQKLNLKKDEFIGLASHELKTPVTSLSAYLQLLKRRLSDDDTNKSFITRAVHQVSKLSDLLSNLLNVSRIETGQLPLDVTSFDLLAVVQDMVSALQYGNQSHRIELQSDCKSLMVTADQERIEQVITNLISNAVKYSPSADRVNVIVSQAGNNAVVSVQDFGMGINPEHHERIFSRFYRVDEMSAHISGLGLGLYISREIISRHKGALTVKSEPGKGSVFTFTIPLVQS